MYHKKQQTRRKRAVQLVSPRCTAAVFLHHPGDFLHNKCRNFAKKLDYLAFAVYIIYKGHWMSRGKLFQTGFFRIVKRDGLPPAFLLPKFRKTDTIDRPEYRERN